MCDERLRGGSFQKDCLLPSVKTFFLEPGFQCAGYFQIVLFGKREVGVAANADFGEVHDAARLPTLKTRELLNGIRFSLRTAVECIFMRESSVRKRRDSAENTSSERKSV